ncbi:hypothetical protein DERF_009596 [Dermatophagoides farinae]|uniref:Uncharacterized protein n=1 Tax=Dermatophagoides farinae TaxID=6954 RepID=A0A922HVF2_DERFA|nr:hypothetical protein DERF_009596 [Dermatophagoides farinae]
MCPPTVPNSWNFSHNSFVSNFASIFINSSQLQRGKQAGLSSGDACCMTGGGGGGGNGGGCCIDAVDDVKPDGDILANLARSANELLNSAFKRCCSAILG